MVDRSRRDLSWLPPTGELDGTVLQLTPETLDKLSAVRRARIVVEIDGERLRPFRSMV